MPHPLRSLYNAMLQRCYNPKRRCYPQWGGRGIRVCDRWLASFEAFCQDVEPRPSLAHSLDRIDVDGHYEPGNCRWATPSEQAHNRTDSRRVTINGKTQSFAAWVRALGISLNSAHARLRRGCTPEYALLRGLFTTRGR